jgi:hypothetical protein
MIRPRNPLLLAALALLSLRAAQRRVDLHQPTEIPADRLLFVDDEWIEARSGVTRVMHRAVKQPAPVIVGDTPWECWTISVRGAPNVLYDREARYSMQLNSRFRTRSNPFLEEAPC